MWIKKKQINKHDKEKRKVKLKINGGVWKIEQTGTKEYFMKNRQEGNDWLNEDAIFAFYSPYSGETDMYLFVLY